MKRPLKRSNKLSGFTSMLMTPSNGIVKERLAQDDIKETGFLLDGYPRTIEQAHALDQTLSDLGITLEGVINIEVNPESLLDA